jgi:uridine kinase
LDIKIYVDADEDERFIRRLVRDTKERGRTMESVIEQYLNIVKPMFLQFVEPSKRYADIVIPQGGLNDVAIDIIVSKIKSRT